MFSHNTREALTGMAEAKTAIEEGEHIDQSSNVVDDIKLTDEHMEHTDTYIAHNV